MSKTNTPKNWFKSWSNEYDRTLGKVPRHHLLLDTVVGHSGIKDGYNVLDIGCGTGLSSLKLLKAADCRVTAFDISKDMMDIFKEKARSLKIGDRLRFKLGDAVRASFKDREFDLAISTVTLHHIKHKDKFSTVKKIYRALKPRGRFVIGEIDLDTTGKLTGLKRLDRIMRYIVDELKLAAKSGGEGAVSRMFDNGKRHLFNDGEYCVSAVRWAELSRRAGFRKVLIKNVGRFRWFKVIVCDK